MRYRRWSETDLDELAGLLVEDLEISEIAERLDRTERSVEYEMGKAKLRGSVSAKTMSEKADTPTKKSKQRKADIQEASVEFLDKRLSEGNYKGIWDTVIKFQQELHKVDIEQEEAHLSIDTKKWIGIAFQGDLHLGNMATDYVTLLRHKQLIKDTKNLYLVINGDYCDNYISGSHAGGAFEALFPPATQKTLAKQYVTDLEEKILALVAGCFMKGSKVTMADGQEKNIEDVDVGDMVMSEDGLPQRVSRRYSNYHDGKVLKVYTEGNNEPQHITDDHESLVLKKEDTMRADGHHVKKYSFIKENLREMRADQIEVGDYLCSPIPRSKKGSPSTKFGDYKYNIDIPFLRLAGYWLAEGWYRKDDGPNKVGLEFAFHIKEREYIEEIKSIIDYLNPELSLDEYTNKEKNCTTVSIEDNELARMFYELFGEYSDKKFIHPEILAQPPSKLIHLVNTFGNGDGCTREQHGTTDITLTTVSRKLMNGLDFALTKAGIFHSVRQQDRSNQENKKDDYQINFGEESLENLEELLQMHKEPRSIAANASRLQKRGKEQRAQKVYDGYIWHKVTKIEEEEFSGFVYNLTIDETSQLVVNKRLTHNCHDLWSLKIDDFDLTEYLAKHGNAIYLGSGGDLYLEIGKVTYKVRMRHKYRYNSADNPTHTVKKMFEKDGGFDVGVVSHNHISAIEESTKTGLDGTLKRIFLRSGSYKAKDRYSKQLGFMDGQVSVPTVLFNPHTRDMRGFQNLEEGIQYLNFLNKQT